MNIDWTPERTAQLKNLWAVGHSAAECASLLGLGLNARSAVLGKLHRLGIKRGIVARYTQAKPAKPKRPAGEIKRAARTMGSNILRLNGMVAIKTIQMEELPPEPPAPDKLVAFTDLENGMCRWPFGDPKEAGFGFCGCKSVPQQSYCETHMRKAWVAPQPRRWAEQEAECADRKGRAFRVVKMGVEG